MSENTKVLLAMLAALLSIGGMVTTAYIMKETVAVEVSNKISKGVTRIDDGTTSCYVILERGISCVVRP